MKTVPISLDDEVYEKAEHKAALLHTSVSQIAAEYVGRWATDGASVDEARRLMAARFAQPDWQFALGQRDDRTERNARR